MKPFTSKRSARFHYAAEAIVHVEETSCSLGCKRGDPSDPEAPGGSCTVLLDILMEEVEIKELADNGQRVVCLVREPLDA